MRTSSWFSCATKLTVKWDTEAAEPLGGAAQPAALGQGVCKDREGGGPQGATNRGQRTFAHTCALCPQPSLLCLFFPRTLH